MKKCILFILTTIFIVSCSISWANDPQKNTDLEHIWNVTSGEKLTTDKLNFHFDYPIYEGSTIDKTIKEWWEKLINDANKEIEENKKNWLKDITPELYYSFNKYKDKWINSIVYNVWKMISRGHPENIIKIFYIDEKWKEINQNDFFKFTEQTKNIFEQKLLNKVKTIEWVFEDQEALKSVVKNYLNDMKFYFDSEKIVFLFEQYTVWPYSSGILEVEFYFSELKEYLNPEIFPEIKKELEKKQEQEAKQSNLKNDESNSWKNEVNAAKIETKTWTQKEKTARKDWKKYIALTFDDGPSKKTTPQLLDILKENNVKATFFVLWKNASFFPEIIKREHDEWHEIWSHTWDHPNLLNLSEAKIKKQIESTDEEIQKIIWIKPTLLRPPYGSHNKKIDNMAKKTIVMWNVDSLDWKNRNVKKNLSTALKQVQPGSIILFHDIHQPSVDTIDSLIKELKKQWYEFVTVSELLQEHTDVEKKVCFGEFKCDAY